MKKAIITVMISVLSVGALEGQVARGRVGIGDVRIVCEGDSLLRVDYTATVARHAARRGRTLVFAPLLQGAGFRQSLSPVVVQGRGAKIVRRRHSWRNEAVSDVIYAHNGTTVHVSDKVPFQEWMYAAELRFEAIEGGCCTSLKLGDVIVDAAMPAREFQAPPLPSRALTMADSLAAAFAFVRPASEYDGRVPRVTDDERDRLLAVYFRTNDHRIDPQWLDNAHTLNNLVGVINMINDSGGARVTKVVVAGFASPEGSMELNDRLAFRRAIAVKEFLAHQTGVPLSTIMAHNGSIDWQGLRIMVERSNLPERDEVLALIDGAGLWRRADHAAAMARLRRMAGGATWQRLMEECFPYMRSGAFIKVYYENR